MRALPFPRFHITSFVEEVARGECIGWGAGQAGYYMSGGRKEGKGLDPSKSLSMEIWDNLSCPQQGNYNLIWIAGHIWSEYLVWHCYCDERYWDPAIFAKCIHFFIAFTVFGSFCSSHKLSTISMEVAKILSLNRSNFHKRSFVRLFVPHHQHSLNFYFPKFSRREIWRSALSNSGQTTFCSHSETLSPPFEYVILQRKWRLTRPRKRGA